MKSLHLHAVARRNAVKDLAAAGKSNREIAKLLGVDEATVRRDLRIMNLPQDQLHAINLGRASAPLLKRAKQQERAEKARLREECEKAEEKRRAEEERKNGTLSDALADVIEKWLARELNVGPDALPIYGAQVLRETERMLWRNQFRLPKGSVLASPEAVIEHWRPEGLKTMELPNIISFCSYWLLAWLPRVAPEDTIRDGALKKLSLRWENRYGFGW